MLLRRDFARPNGVSDHQKLRAASLHVRELHVTVSEDMNLAHKLTR